VVAAAGNGTVGPLRTGGHYRLSGLLVAGPPDREPTGEHCPGCEGTLRRGGAVDVAGPAVAETVGLLGLSEPFGVLDGRTELTRLRGASATSSGHEDTAEATDPPAYVCTECARRVDED
jgi:hypothetical protein